MPIHLFFICSIEFFFFDNIIAWADEILLLFLWDGLVSESAFSAFG